MTDTRSPGLCPKPRHALLLGGALLMTAADAMAVSIAPTRTQWQPLIIDVAGPAASETDDAPNPFLDVRLDLIATAPSGREFVVPGFFAGNGRGFGTGNIWRVRFAPDEAGNWQYRVRFLEGEDIAVADDGELDTGTPIGEHDARGTVTIAPRDAGAPGLLAAGRIEYVGEHYLKQADGDWWLKGGVDSPENFFGYAGFDNTIDQSGGVATASLTDGVHRYAPHVNDWREGDPLFTSETTGVDSRGIIGAVNYLAAEGVNSIYFLPLNLGGDGRETYPFIGATGSAFDDTHYDVSKLHQWWQVVHHMQRRGVSAHLVLSEQEAGNTEWLDGGQLGVERKLFYRELVARFSALNGVKWNIGEESRYGTARETAFAAHLRALDWADHPIAVHSHRDRPEPTYAPLLGNTDFDTSSIQFSPENADRFAETWRERSAAAGWKWVVELDEVGPAGTGLTDDNMDALRRQVLYPVYFSGASLEWYFGYHPLPLGGDMQTEDFRTRADMYRWMRIAREFMQTYLPLERMTPNDAALSGGHADDQAFSAPGEIHALYLQDGAQGRVLDVTDGAWERSWFDPRAGRFVGSPDVMSGATLALGEAPERAEQDWVVLLRYRDDPDDTDGTPVTPVAVTSNPPVPAAPAETTTTGASGGAAGSAGGDAGTDNGVAAPPGSGEGEGEGTVDPGTSDTTTPPAAMLSPIDSAPLDVGDGEPPVAAARETQDDGGGSLGWPAALSLAVYGFVRIRNPGSRGSYTAPAPRRTHPRPSAPDPH